MKLPGKLLDRHIFLNVAGTFFFSIAVFMALLLAMDLLPQLIKNIAVLDKPVKIALTIFVCRIPSMLVYAFPMSVLLGILLVFNRMSSDSEMVTIRAGGISFVRVTAPVLCFALVITGLTFWISNDVAPEANKRAAYLNETAIKKANPVLYQHIEHGRLVYSIQCADLDITTDCMHQVTITFFTDDLPIYLMYAAKAHWERKLGQWSLPRAYAVDHIRAENTSINLHYHDMQAHILQVMESPAELDTVKKATDDFTAKEIQARITRKIAMHKDEAGGRRDRSVCEDRMAVSRRFAMPLYCLVFAMIAAPLGLRDHRTSAALGLGLA